MSKGSTEPQKKSVIAMFKSLSGTGSRGGSSSETMISPLKKGSYEAIGHDTDHDTGTEDNADDEPTPKQYTVQINDTPTSRREAALSISTTAMNTRKSQDHCEVKQAKDGDDAKYFAEELETTYFSDIFENTGELYRKWKKYEGLVEKRIQELVREKPRKRLLQDILEFDDIVNTNQRLLRQNKLIDPSKKAWQSKLNWFPQQKLYPLMEHISHIYRDSALKPHISYTPSIKLSTSIADLERIDSKLKRGWNKPTINRIKSTMFDRECTKYWVKNENLLKVIAAIIPHLPIYRHPLSKDPSMAQKISSVYLDDDDCKCYHERINKEQDARAVRIRWYGENQMICFIERKLHKKDDAQSLKERFRMKGEKIVEFIEGEEVFDTTINKGLAMKRLQEEVSEMIQVFGLAPKTRIVYDRISFQLDTTNAIRISLDSDLKFIKEQEDLLDNGMWFTEDENLAKDDIVTFPFNVLELKLCGKYIDEPPDWIQGLMDSDLMMKCYKFSKYGQSIHSFFASDIYIIPRWIEEYPEVFDENHKEIDVWDGPPPEQAAEKKWICCGRCRKEPDTNTTGKKRKVMNPKVYFSNERTFLQWFQAAVFVGSAGLTILSMNPTDISGPLLITVSFLILVWSVITYYWRNYKLLRNSKEGLNDMYGPMVLVIVMIFVMGYSLKTGVEIV